VIGQGRRTGLYILTSTSLSTELFVRLGGSKKIKYHIYRKNFKNQLFILSVKCRLLHICFGGSS
jgi:hypothetical protein